MKRGWSMMLVILSMLPLLLAGVCGVSAAGAAGEEGLLTPALSVLAAQNEMSVATLRGNDYYFSEDVFARSLNLSSVEAITVVSLPEITEGELMMGSERVSAGQRIAAKDLGLLSFVASDDGARQTSFVFSPALGGYEMVCNIHVLSEVNYSPTISMVGEEARSVSTYGGFAGYGVLSAYDPEGDALIFEVVRAPENGIVVMTDRGCGEYVYLPREGFLGEDRFCYVARDVYGNYSTMAEVSVTVDQAATRIVYRDMEGRREHNAALRVTAAGIMQGEQSGEDWCFHPDRTVNRAEFLVMAMQALGVDSLPSVRDTGFADDALLSDELKGYVAAAKELGYIEGVMQESGSCSFLPEATITRAEAAVIVARMLKLGQTEVSVSSVPAFADGDEIPAWASDAIATLTLGGVLHTVGGAISPNALLTRADAASILSAMLQRR